MPHKPGNGAIFGIVSEDGLVKDASPVYLYDMQRDLGPGRKRLLGRRFTRPDGGFEFAGLDTEYSDYMLMATDEDGVDPKNALIQDRIQPIPAHSGTGQHYEWYLQALRLHPVVGFIGLDSVDDTDGMYAPRPRMIGADILWNTSATLTGGLAWTPTSPVVPPEVANIASVELENANPAIIYGALFLPLSTGAQYSFELLVDIDEMFAASATEGTQISFVFMNFNSRRNLITEDLRMGITVDATNPNILSFRAAGYGDSSQIIDVDVSGYSGLQHLCMSIVPGANTQVWVGKTLVAQEACSVDMSYRSSQHMMSCGFYRGSATAGRHSMYLHAVTGLSCPLAVAFRNQLSQTVVERLYDALYNNQLTSLVSGYAAEVMKRYPLYYWRLDNFDTLGYAPSEVHCQDCEVGLEPYLGSRLEVNGTDTDLDSLVSSAVAGRTAVAKVNDSTTHLWGPVAAHILPWRKDRFSVQCWVRFDTVAPAKDGELFRIATGRFLWHNASWTSATYILLRQLTSNELAATILEGNSSSTYTFSDYTISAGVWQHLTVVVDKISDLNEIRLYVGDESTSPVLVQSIPCVQAKNLWTHDNSGSVNPTYETSIIDSETRWTHSTPAVWGATRMLRDFHGALAEVSGYSELLTLQDVQDIWAARTVV